jgi:hypothetical protein
VVNLERQFVELLGMRQYSHLEFARRQIRASNSRSIAKKPVAEASKAGARGT